MKIFRLTVLATLFLLAFPSQSRAQGKIGIGDVFPGKVEYGAFTLSQPEKVKISGRGGAFHHEGQMMVYYGWIIDSETRKVVWHAGDDIEKPDFDYGEFDIDDEVTLNKGTYEVYFTGSFHHWNGDWSINNVGSFFNEVFGDRNKEKYKLAIQDDMGMVVTGENLTKVSIATVMEKKLAGALVSILKPDNNDNVKKGFSLSGETTLRIYAIGEGRKDETYDYAWIYDIDKNKRVWVMDYSNTDFAGGAEKNMMVNEKITLPAGNYLVSYATDDSHSYNEWNSLPPHDPQFSGITIWPDTDKDKRNIVAFRAPEAIKPVLQLTKVRDDDYVSKGLTVKSSAEFRDRKSVV